ncbi:mitochondrial carrier [Tuber magnatum]|uniref:Mitochondrial carrier n=1 Tax=Tuber magnatum TaxID=42249 RepID=A0A317SVX0_9PEZI|nr:mitochondrial carrier [Tuber magnatum]
MSTQQGPNPLRPYYIPPPVIPPLNSSAPTPAPLPTASYSYPPAPTDTRSGGGILADYSEYLEDQSPNEIIKGWFQQAAVQYSLQLIGQPCENSRTLLQCGAVPKGTGKRIVEEDEEDADDSASDDSDPPYFSENIEVELDDGGAPRIRGVRKMARGMTDRTGYVIGGSQGGQEVREPWMLETVPGRVNTVGEILRALWSKEGYAGFWKGQNATFVYNILMRTLESWTGSFLSAVLSLPDPGMGEIADSADPLASLGVAVAASTIAALILAPIDIVRTRLVITPSTEAPRNLLPNIHLLPSYTCPPNLLLPTALHAALPSFIFLGTPHFIRSRFGIDPVGNPTTFSLVTFLSSTAGLIVRLPLETALRRGQAAVTKPKKTVVPVGRYTGVFGTMWSVAREEGGGRYGVEGLYRGWRMGIWTGVGVLGLGLFGVRGEPGEF